MAKIVGGFDANKVEPSQPRDFPPIPPGPQTVWIVNSTMIPVKPKEGQDPDGDYGQYLKLEIEVIEGEFERRKLFENLNLENANPQTVQIAQQTLREICLACNKPNIKDSEELHNIPFVADLVVTPGRTVNGRTYPPGNKVRSYRPADGGFVAPQPSQRSNGHAGAGAGTEGFVPPATSRTPAAGGGGLPWGQKR